MSADLAQDVADLAEECEDEIQESKGSARLGRRVDAMIGKIDTTLLSLETDSNTTLKEMREDRFVVGGGYIPGLNQSLGKSLLPRHSLFY